jgi:hypothetical protein
MNPRLAFHPGGGCLAPRLSRAGGVLVSRDLVQTQFGPLLFPIHDVVNRAGIFNSQLASHAGRVPCAISCVSVNIKNRPLYKAVLRRFRV